MSRGRERPLALQIRRSGPLAVWWWQCPRPASLEQTAPLAPAASSFLSCRSAGNLDFSL